LLVFAEFALTFWEYRTAFFGRMEAIFVIERVVEAFFSEGSPRRAESLPIGVPPSRGSGTISFGPGPSGARPP